jgi:predicted AAA+ superfamily ATPase
MYSRVITDCIKYDLTDKMVLLSGPRQCGKTTLARSIEIDGGTGAYFNWDIEAHRKILRAGNLPASRALWILDEVHKNRGWRNWLKGIYDLYHDKHSILVTGSARLELYSRGGDSLQGRYFMHHLHPLTLNEVHAGKAFCEEALCDLSEIAPASDLESLLRFSGFPEPFRKGEMRFANRWKTQYANLLLRDDVRTLEAIKDVDKLEVLFEQLGRTVGSVLSLNALREDLEVAFDTVRNWVAILDRLYATFRLTPYGPPKIRAVKKEQKLYFWDWTRPESPAGRMENVVALHLLRLAHWIEDTEGVRTELRYFRTPMGHEVDFVLLKDRKPWMAVEVKADDRPLDSNLKYLLERNDIPLAFQIAFSGSTDVFLPNIGKHGVRLVPARRFLANLP